MRTVCGTGRRVQRMVRGERAAAVGVAAVRPLAAGRRPLLSGELGEQRRGGARLDQVDGTTCGSAVLVALAAWADPAETSRLDGARSASTGTTGVAAGVTIGFGARFDARQKQVHRESTRWWPQAIGTSPWGMVGWLRRHAPGAGPYRVRLVDDMSSSDVDRALAAADTALAAGRPVPLLVGAFVPRHYCLAVSRAGATWRVYEPSSGQIRELDTGLVRRFPGPRPRPRLRPPARPPPALLSPASSRVGERGWRAARRLGGVTDTLPSRMAELPAQWTPGEVADGMYERWVEAGYFTADAGSGKPPFCIVIPPPNVTGSLHIGHAFEHTLIDVLCRRRRMQGYEVLWLPGMDHASIAVHALVERALAAEGTSRRELGRAAFIERTWAWKAEYGGAILAQMRRLGDSVDWSRERFTMDERSNRAVLTMFKRLFDDGLIYRAERMVNWSPEMRSVLSDVEVEHRDVEGELVSIRYGDGADALVVATTRVETMLGDTAVAVHPDDERYAHLVGREIELPLVGRMIRIVADEHVDPSFGTGAVKVTPAHDPNDFEIGRRHHLPMPTIMDESGRIANTGTEFDGMDRFTARVRVREALAAQGRIVAEKRPYVHSVGHASRGKYEPIEPRLSLQWFVKVGPLAKAAGDAVRSGDVAVHPQELEPRWFDWVDNMHDWCISRQLWWGHRIPVWYSPDGEVVCLGPDEQPPAGWTQDEDVLDTWFSSGLWPFSTLGWPEQTADLARFYPTSVLVTGYDILFFWVARMMMFGLYAMAERPFDTIALHGMIRDQYGKKMSKTVGNTVDPNVWMDAYGTDAVRFALARVANPGTDAPIGDDNVQSARNFGTKLWNVTRFALANGASSARPLPASPTDADAWILGRLREVRDQVDALLEDYQFAKATEALYHFTWDEFCSWYVELAKPQLADGATADGTQAVLGHVLDVLLRLLHPISPFITEALWQALTGGESVVVAEWPVLVGAPVDPGAHDRITAVQKLATEVRRFRTEQRVPDARRVPGRFVGLAESGLGEHRGALAALLRLDPAAEGFAPTATLEVNVAGATGPAVDVTGAAAAPDRGGSTAAVSGTVRIELDLSGVIDVPAERARLGRDLAAAQKELDQADRKLGNPKFVDKAPAAIVDGIRARRDGAAADIERLAARLAALPS